jgi:hypothetical protein
MNKRFGFLEKKQSSLAIVLSPNGINVVFTSRRFRQKMLKGQNIFIGKVAMTSKEWSNAEVLEKVRIWWESMNDEELFQRLLNAPLGKRPILNFDNIMFIDFNLKREFFLKSLFDTQEPIEQDD